MSLGRDYILGPVIQNITLTMVYYALIQSQLPSVAGKDWAAAEVGGCVSPGNRNFIIVRVIISLISPKEIQACPES